MKSMGMRIGAVVGVLFLALGTWLALRTERGSESAVETAPEPAAPALDEPTDPLGHAPVPGDRAGAAPRVEVPAATEPVLAERATTVRPLALRLVDGETGEPAAWLTVEARASDDTVERLETDADGVLRSETAFQPGAIYLTLMGERDRRDLIQKRRHEAERIANLVTLEHGVPQAGGGPLEVSVPLGPTYRFRMDLPEGKSWTDFEAMLTSGDRRLAWDKVYAAFRDAPDAPGDGWLRFSPLARLVSSGEPWAIHVHGSEGMWKGKVEVDAVVGRYGPLLSAALTATGRVVGIVTDSEGEPVRTMVRLDGVGARFDDQDNRPLLNMTRAEDGRYDAGWVPPGRYTMKLKIEDHLDYEATVSVSAGETLEHDVALVGTDGGPRNGVIEGRVTSESGTYSGHVIALLMRADSRSFQSADVEWSGEPGQRIGRFRFDELAERDYTVSLRATDLLAAQPHVRAVRPYHEGIELVPLEFVILDSVAGSDVVFRALQKGTGEPIPDFEVRLTFLSEDVRRSGGRRSVATDGAAHVSRVQTDARFDYKVLAEGYVPSWGEATTLADGRELVIDAELERGWGTMVSVFGPEREPLEGARVFLDERDVGLTDEKGELWVSLPARPTRARASYRDWVLTSEGDVYPDSQRFREWFWGLRISLGPAR